MKERWPQGSQGKGVAYAFAKKRVRKMQVLGMAPKEGEFDLGKMEHPGPKKPHVSPK